MRIVHLTSVHPWSDIRIFVKMCGSLAYAGHDVCLVVPRADGAEIEKVDGVTVYSVPPSHNRFQRMTQTAEAVLNLAVSLNGDIYHFHDPELLRLAPKWQAKLKRPFVYDAHEDYRVKMREKTWLPFGVGRLLDVAVGKMEDSATSKLAGIVCATPNIAARFRTHALVETIYNYPIINELIGGEVTERVHNQFVYVGGVTRIRGAREMVEAAGISGRVVLALAGRISPDSFSKELSGLQGWGNTDCKGFLNRDGVRNLLSKSCAGLVLSHPTPANEVSYPIKLFEYMSAGLPVIASDFPLWREIISSSGCGLLVDPLNAVAIAKAMEYILDHPVEAEEMGRRGRKAVVEKYSWDAESRKLIAFYEKVLQRCKVYLSMKGRNTNE